MLIDNAFTTLLHSAWSWTFTASWAEVFSIITGVVAVLFAGSQWFVPFVVKTFLRWWGDWPVKVKVTSATVDNGVLGVLKERYEIRPRWFTVTERHHPRVYRMSVTVKGRDSNLEETMRHFDSLEEHLDQIYEDCWPRRWAKEESEKYGPPTAVRVVVHAGYRLARRVDIESAWRNVMIQE